MRWYANHCLRLLIALLAFAYSANITRPSRSYSIKKQKVTRDAMEVNSQLTMRHFKNVIEKKKEKDCNHQNYQSMEADGFLYAFLNFSTIYIELITKKWCLLK